VAIFIWVLGFDSSCPIFVLEFKNVIQHICFYPRKTKYKKNKTYPIKTLSEERDSSLEAPSVCLPLEPLCFE
jgi:hypothetical protein